MTKHRTPHQNPTTDLPAYLNGTLSGRAQRAISIGLKSDDRTRTELAAWQKIQAAVTSQTPLTPRTSKQQLLSQVKTLPQASRLTSWLPWTSGLVLAAVALIALWVAVQPGINLSWSVQGGSASAFRIYRAPANTNDFQLVQEIPARPNVQTYNFIDTALSPEQNYIYRVEGEQPGLSTLSQTITVSSHEAVNDQLLIFFVSLIIGISAVKLMQYWLESKWLYQVQHHHALG